MAMNAREAIAKFIGKSSLTPKASADLFITHLSAAGFTIMSKEDVEAVRDDAIEDAARHLEGWGDMYGDNAARAIRSLKSSTP